MSSMRDNADKPEWWPCVEHGYEKTWCNAECVQWDGLHMFPPEDSLAMT